MILKDMFYTLSTILLWGEGFIYFQTELFLYPKRKSLQGY